MLIAYLCITSPTKRCGKTLLAEVIGLVSARSKTTVNVSEAALFRMIEMFRPTIIIDEAEMLGDRKSERGKFLLSLLNAGHRKGANVIRCVGSDHTPTEFPVYCPKVLLAIGNLGSLQKPLQRDSLLSFALCSPKTNGNVEICGPALKTSRNAPNSEIHAS